MGFGMVGFTAYDNRYTFKSKRGWVKPYPNAVCVASSSPYEKTQMIPSEAAETAVLATYRRGGELCLELADYIRSLGYHAQVHSFADAASAVIPMFVAAGLGQQGAMGYLSLPPLRLPPPAHPDHHRCPVTHGPAGGLRHQRLLLHLQVCVNRCPGRALMRDKVWWRGVEKFKIVAKRCRPVMAAYASCAVCMKVCPIQRYGLKEVMDHYASTGQVLGKGTHDLEGYDLEGLGYFGPGDLPRFDADFFHNPEGTAEGFILEELKTKIQSGLVAEGPEGDRVFQEFRAQMEEAVKGGGDVMEPSGTASRTGNSPARQHRQNGRKAMLKIGHTVTVPGSLKGAGTDSEPDVIPIPQELETVPGHRQDPDTVNYYTRNYPLETHNIEQFAWASWYLNTGDIKDTLDEHLRLDRPLVLAARDSGDVEPSAEPVPGKDVTSEIKQKALDVGFAMVGFTAYDNRYTFKSKRGWVKPYPNAICVAVEQPYEETQTIPSETAEKAALATYRRGGALILQLADYIRSLGYHAQVHSYADAAAAIIPMFVGGGYGTAGRHGVPPVPPTSAHGTG